MTAERRDLPEVFQGESAIADRAAALAQSGQPTPEDYRELADAYRRLLRSAAKIVRMGDANQNKLVKAQHLLEQVIQRYKNLAEQKAELLGVIVHDIKNKVGGIAELSEVLLDERFSHHHDPAELHKIFTLINKTSREAADAVNETLHREHVLSDQVMIEKDWCDLSEMVRTIVENMRHYAESKHIDLKIEKLQPLNARVDEFLLREVFDNLINNAIKFSPPQRHVYVALETAPLPQANTPCARFCVRDEGQGLSHDDLTHLFERYAKRSAKPTGTETSSGVGLSIVKKMVDLHGGRIWAESAGPGHGAAFYVELPLGA